MSDKTETKTVCPCCENRCPSDELKCGRGKAHFGQIPEGKGRGHNEVGEAKTIEDEVIILLHQCGHFLHHASGETNHQALLKDLSEEEKRDLAVLLKKCLLSFGAGSSGGAKR